jgi:GDP-D-mannose 3',5'-epimerase
VMRSDYPEPLNVGQDRMISINELVDLVAGIAGVQLTRRHVAGPVGVRGRNSDNTRVRQVLDWEPRVSLEDGLRRTYAWIEAQVQAELQPADGNKSNIATA